MIESICDNCKEKLTEKGGLLFSPPSKAVNRVFDLDGEIDVTRKFHICVKCYNLIIEKFFKGDS